MQFYINQFVKSGLEERRNCLKNSLEHYCKVTVDRDYCEFVTTEKGGTVKSELTANEDKHFIRYVVMYYR